MKHIKLLLAVALVSVFVISCKETPKVEETAEEVIEVVEEVAVVADSTVVEAVEVAIDSVVVAE
jgi:outer membrane lipoprotein-sorting protein